ncbi:hypothetical protein [Gottschalkia acidurici]|nr:hypothetical protein [Gottschalkia acidurici]
MNLKGNKLGIKSKYFTDYKLIIATEIQYLSMEELEAKIFFN